MSDSIGLAGTWGSKFAVKPKVDLDLNTTYKVMMNESQLTSETRKDMANSYSRFRKKEGSSTEPMIQFKKTRQEVDEQEARIEELFKVVQQPPVTRALSRAVSKTASNRLHSDDAPPAVGRSGMIVHQFTNRKMAVPGERFNDTGNPMRDSFINRSWMYRDDPSLLYMRHGRPEAFMPNDVSLAIGSFPVAPGWVHHRSAILTGGPLTKTGAARSGIFQDAKDPPRE